MTAEQAKQGQDRLWPAVSGAPGRTRTCNLLFRRQLLCPLSYRGVVGRRIPEPGQARDCQERPSTAAPLTTVAGPVGRPAGKSTVDKGSCAVQDT
jgi:hypothetical protein